MIEGYAKVVVLGSPISKSNFKLFNINGRAILPVNSGKYHDRYAIYEEEIALIARSQNPGIILSEGLIAILKVYYKSEKRHPDTNNIPKSIFDGIEKSGLIVNDAQVKKIIIEEFYDNENPRFELELFSENLYDINYSINKRIEHLNGKVYNPPPNRSKSIVHLNKPTALKEISNNLCSICLKTISKENSISADKGKTLICKMCFKKLF